MLLDGMAARTPVGASDIEAFKTVTQDGRSARLFENRNPSALAEWLTHTLEAGPATDGFIEAGIERAEEFSMRVQAGTYVSLYEALANGDVPPAMDDRGLR